MLQGFREALKEHTLLIQGAAVGITLVAHALFSRQTVYSVLLGFGVVIAILGLWLLNSMFPRLRAILSFPLAKADRRNAIHLFQPICRKVTHDLFIFIWFASASVAIELLRSAQV